MAETDNTSKSRRRRSLLAQNGSVETSPASTAGSPSLPLSRSTLEQVIEAERAQLLQAHGVLRCLYEVLLHAEGDDAIFYAEAAHVAAKLIDESVERLDLVRLRPMMAAMKRGEADLDLHGRYEIKEDSPAYVC